METRWHIAQNMDDWLAQAQAMVTRAEHAALARHGVFHVVLAGGSTPRQLYAALARQPHDWARWQVWLGDERCLPVDDPERNSVMVQSSLMEATNIPHHQCHAIPAESGPHAAAEDYGRQLKDIGPFDLVLLGLGEDGHTASLFPGQDWGSAPDAASTLPIFDAPKPPPNRVSLSARRLSDAHQVLFLVSGAGKRGAVARWRSGEAIPASAIRPPGGVDVLAAQDSLPDTRPSGGAL